MLLCIRDSTVIDHDEPSRVLVWIQERITCQVPHKESNPHIHRLLGTKCTNVVYIVNWGCKCSGNMFITRCRCRFLRQVCEHPKLNSVQESLKCRLWMSELPHSDSEVRINEYNPLLLMLWKLCVEWGSANTSWHIDVRYVKISTYIHNYGRVSLSKSTAV